MDLKSIILRNPHGEPHPDSRTRTVLQLLIDRGITPDIGCGEGMCGMCKCKLVKGEVEHTDDTIALLKPDEIVPCTASIKSKEIEIKFEP
ncbi:2Fe-2S iron-sulfur cluster-binding protein [Pseudoalteromonas sp. OFAV1]|jgi:ferredoxin|uniref:2Fe-2S iron-sulfur cluster-binding protein n=1 Tax=Pseudoalteromonas sp. OFAV1 TaxID=2908892 RepID=UPI001F46D4CB|nr:2Fe-2S iron-sulfur cluster-binding protein [Pseudoalteromonas sp. OFAV1]MCF2902097.1 2Fe-2S iron-sulfur cluster-binding protein [Pseudoalteromonas sp. OFAV1]